MSQAIRLGLSCLQQLTRRRGIRISIVSSGFLLGSGILAWPKQLLTGWLTKAVGLAPLNHFVFETGVFHCVCLSPSGSEFWSGKVLGTRNIPSRWKS